MCKNLRGQHPVGAELWSSVKVIWGGSKLTCPTLLLVDPSSPDFCRRMLSITCLSDFGYFHPFRRYSRSSSKVVRNRPEFCTFKPPFLSGGARFPEFWDLYYKTELTSDHMVKFHGYRPNQFGDLSLGRKNSSSKT